MALDFHRSDNNELLFGIEEKQYYALQEIFVLFTQWTGIFIDPYGNTRLSTENQQTLIQVIEKYIAVTDLNKDKEKISTILEFKGLIIYFLGRGIDLQLKGD